MRTEEEIRKSGESTPKKVRILRLLLGLWATYIGFKLPLELLLFYTDPFPPSLVINIFVYVIPIGVLGLVVAIPEIRALVKLLRNKNAE